MMWSDGHDRNNCIGVSRRQHCCRPGHRIQRVTALRFAQNVRRFDLRKLGGNDIGVVGARADQHVVSRDDALKAFVRDPQQALAAKYSQQLLGHVLPGQWPEPFS